jgi:peroxiredoxin
MTGYQDTVGGTAEVRHPRYRKALVTTVVALTVSVALNVLLAHRVRSFAHAQSERISERLLSVGTTVPAITAKGLDGQEETISYGGVNQSTVLYIFTPPCTWCARNVDNFKTLLDKQGAAYRFIGLSLSDQGLAEYVSKNELKVPIYSGLSSDTLKTYKLGGTPQTIVVSPEGRVLQSWMGAYVGDQKSQIEAFFHVILPGLRELPKQVAKDNGQAASPQAN